VCLAIPGQIVEIVDESNRLAKVDVAGVRRTVNIGLFDDIGPGDWVLIHVGFAMSRISASEAEEQLRLLAMLGEDAQAMQELDGYTFGERAGKAPS
jgi:hydrogenase expression/formation protein HypC